MKNWFHKKQKKERYTPILPDDPEEAKIQEQEEKVRDAKQRQILHDYTPIPPERQTSVQEEQESKKEPENDPLAGAKYCSKDIFSRLLHAAEEADHRVNCRTVLLLSSGLAGYACQAVVWEEQKETGKSLFLKTTGPDGQTYLFGNAMDKYLLTDKNSVWRMTKGVFQKRHPELEAPNIDEIRKRVEAGVQTPDYQYHTIVNPGQYLYHYGKMWEHELPYLTQNCNSYHEWPLVYNMVLQYALQFSDRDMDPVEAVDFAMENALFASMPDQSTLDLSKRPVKVES